MRASLPPSPAPVVLSWPAMVTEGDTAKAIVDKWLEVSAPWGESEVACLSESPRQSRRGMMVQPEGGRERGIRVMGRGSVTPWMASAVQ